MIGRAQPVPARILKRRELEASLAVPQPVAPACDPAHAERRIAPADRRVGRTARILQLEGRKALLEVSCSCGESTRVELLLSEGVDEGGRK